MASAISPQLQSRYITQAVPRETGSQQQHVAPLPTTASLRRSLVPLPQPQRSWPPRQVGGALRACRLGRARLPPSSKQIGSATLQSQFGISSNTGGLLQMSYGYGSSRETEGDIQKWTLLQVRGWVLAAFALTFLLAPGYVFNEVLPNLGKLFKDPRAYPEVWSYGQQAKGAVRHLPTLAHFAGALFFSSSVLDILIARARSHEALRFKVVGDLLASVILVAYLTSSVIWNFYPRSDLALVVLYLLRGLWDLRIWFEENYAT